MTKSMQVETAIEPHSISPLKIASEIYGRWLKSPTDDCLPMPSTGSETQDGYPAFSYQGSTEYAHHWIASWHHGRQRRDDEHVMHSCDNPRCINPRHLSYGTRSENAKDMVAKGRNKKPSRDNIARNAGIQADFLRRRAETDLADSRIIADVASRYSLSTRTIRDILKPLLNSA